MDDGNKFRNDRDALFNPNNDCIGIASREHIGNKFCSLVIVGEKQKISFH